MVAASTGLFRLHQCLSSEMRQFDTNNAHKALLLAYDTVPVMAEASVIRWCAQNSSERFLKSLPSEACRKHLLFCKFVELVRAKI